MKTKSKTAEPNTFDGNVNVCAHRVSFWYELNEHELTDDLREHLEEEAERRSTECITQGYHSGELNCLYVFPNDTDEEIRGWWKIEP